MNNGKRKLLKKFIDGHCNQQEQQTVRILLDTSEGKALLHEVMAEEDNGQEDDFSLSETESYNSSSKVKDWKSNVFQRIKNDEPGTSRPVRKLKFLRYAAVWAGLLFAGGLAFWQFKKTTLFVGSHITYIKKTNQGGVPVHYLLPDSSLVYLAAGSTLCYPEKYTGDERGINLKGEAFFEVKHDPEHPFIIHTGSVQTRVLGTSFKVTAFDDEPLEVAVATGKVGVSNHTESEIHELAKLTPGMKIGYNVKTGKARVGKVDVYSLQQWKSGELIFDQQPLLLVAAELQRRYGVTIQFKDAETAAYRVSGTFPASETVAQVIKVLSAFGQFKYNVGANETYNLYKTDEDMK